MRSSQGAGCLSVGVFARWDGSVSRAVRVHDRQASSPRGPCQGDPWAVSNTPMLMASARSDSRPANRRKWGVVVSRSEPLVRRRGLEDRLDDAHPAAALQQGDDQGIRCAGVKGLGAARPSQRPQPLTGPSQRTRPGANLSLPWAEAGPGPAVRQSPLFAIGFSLGSRVWTGDPQHFAKVTVGQGCARHRKRTALRYPASWRARSSVSVGATCVVSSVRVAVMGHKPPHQQRPPIVRRQPLPALLLWGVFTLFLTRTRADRFCGRPAPGS